MVLNVSFEFLFSVNFYCLLEGVLHESKAKSESWRLGNESFNPNKAGLFEGSFLKKEWLIFKSLKPKTLTQKFMRNSKPLGDGIPKSDFLIYYTCLQ